MNYVDFKMHGATIKENKNKNPHLLLNCNIIVLFFSMCCSTVSLIMGYIQAETCSPKSF